MQFSEVIGKTGVQFLQAWARLGLKRPPQYLSHHRQDHARVNVRAGARGLRSRIKTRHLRSYVMGAIGVMSEGVVDVIADRQCRCYWPVEERSYVRFQIELLELEFSRWVADQRREAERNLTASRIDSVMG